MRYFLNFLLYLNLVFNIYSFKIYQNGDILVSRTHILRHGEKVVDTIYPAYERFPTKYPPGELTDYGQLQMKLIGLDIAKSIEENKRSTHFLGALNYKRTFTDRGEMEKILIYTSNATRCTHSAQIIARELSNFNLEKGMLTFAKPDFLFRSHECKNYSNYIARVVKRDPLFQKLFIGNAELLNKILNQAGFVDKSFPFLILIVADVLSLNRAQGYPLPTWANENVYQLAQDLCNGVFAYFGQRDARFIKMAAGNFVSRLLKQLKQNIQDFASSLRCNNDISGSTEIRKKCDIKYANKIKYYVIVGHDHTITPIMLALNSSAGKRPDFGAMIYFDLIWSESHQHFYINVEFRDALDSPFKTVIDGVNFNNFFASLKHLESVENGWDIGCANKISPFNKLPIDADYTI